MQYKDLLQHYVYGHTCLRPEHVTLLTGAALKSGDVYDRDGRPRWIRSTTHRGRRDFVEAGRDVVLSWLHRLVLLIVWPPVRNPHEQMRENVPLTMSTLFRAIARLLQLGCPPHWLASFCQAVLADAALVTAEVPQTAWAVCPPNSSASRPKYRLDLAVCHLEAKTVAVVWRGQLGKHVLACGGLPPADAIRRLSVPLKPLKDPIWEGGVAIAALNVGLMLADTSVEKVRVALATLHGVSDYQPWARAMASLQGDLRPEAGAVRRMSASCPPGAVHWFSCLTWDSQTHVAEIFLPQVEVDAITARDSAWVAVLFRSDSWAALTQTTQMARLLEEGNATPPSAPANASTAAPFEGRQVRICGLVSRPELNGQSARAHGFEPASGRYTVTLDGSGKTLRVLAKNLLEEEAEAATSSIHEQD
jgi:hypothetical protein